MCTYNGERHLREMLDSISAQTLLPCELVVCDDGSTDATVTMLEAFRAQASFPVHLFRNAVNLGYSRNFSQAVELCRGDVIALCDQDDVWYPNKLQRLAEIFTSDLSIEGVFSDGEIIDEASRPVGRSLWESFAFGSEDQTRFESGEAFDVLLRRNVVTGMAFAFRASAKDLLPSMPSSWIHDGWLAIQLVARSRIVALPDRLVGYRVHGSQQIGTPLPLSGKVKMFKRIGLMGYLGRMHALNLDEYQRTALQFDDLASWLHASSGHEELEARVRSKAAHAHRGVRVLSLGRLRRFPLLAPHVADYKKFSPNGLRGLLRDLVT